MRELLTSKLVADKMTELGYQLVTDIWRGNPENKGIARLEYFNDKNGDRANGVVIRDGYPLNCILIEPGVNIYDEINGGIDQNALIYEGLDIYNTLRKKGFHVSMTPEGVVRYWASKREADYDKYYRNEEILTPKEFIKTIKKTLIALNDYDPDKTILLKNATSEIINIIKATDSIETKCKHIIKIAAPFKEYVPTNGVLSHPYGAEEQFIYLCKGLINFLKKKL